MNNRPITIPIWKISACLLSMLVIPSCGPAPHEPSSSSITAPELRSHIRYLASDELEGRKSGERGNRLAARYVASEFGSFGMREAGGNGSFLQEFTFTAKLLPDERNSLSVSVARDVFDFKLEKHLRPFAFTIDTAVTGQLVFAGYGITDTASKYDDYSGLDVTGKIVVVLRYNPDGQDPHSPYANFSSFRTKAFNARDHGAAGLIIVTGPLDDEEAGLIPFSSDRSFGRSGIACISMRWSAVDSLLARSGRNLRALQEGIKATKQPQSFPLEGTRAKLETRLLKIQATTANVIGLVEGSDPLLRNEYVLLGAHMDHLGYGGEGSGSLRPDTNGIHYGADDNASGTSGLLELAQYYASVSPKPRRSLIFAAFSGEELGLLGSNYYVQNPVFPLEKTIAMINMDMIGRMKESTLVVEGIGTSPKFEDVLRKNRLDTTLLLKLKPDGYGPSDHASFYSKDIPVLFFFTNLHSDYHRPSDTWDKINYNDMERVLGLVSRTATELANEEPRPAFTRVQQSMPMGGNDRGGVRASLGVVPDYAEDIPGLKISGTRPGSAAEKAGLKGGDVIVKFGGKEVKNIYDFTFLLGEFKPGDVVEIVAKRGTEELVLQAKLDERR